MTIQLKTMSIIADHMMPELDGVATQFLMNPFDDDDRPDWHEFHSKNRKPMIFEEIIDHCNHHGLIAVRPIEPTDPSDEIDEEVTI